MFIASSKFLLNDSSVVLGMSRTYREFGLNCGELPLLPASRVLSGVDEICGDGTLSAVLSATMFGVLMLVAECSMFATKSGSIEFEIWPIGIGLPSFVASALFPWSR